MADRHFPFLCVKVHILKEIDKELKLSMFHKSLEFRQAHTKRLAFNLQKQIGPWFGPKKATVPVQELRSAV